MMNSLGDHACADILGNIILRSVPSRVFLCLSRQKGRWADRPNRVSLLLLNPSMAIKSMDDDEKMTISIN